MKQHSSIEINGYSYGADSSQALDGLLSHSEVASTAQPVPVTVHAQATKAVRHAAQHAKSHTPQSSRTLMRRAVHKPGKNTAKHSKIQQPIGFLTKESSVLVVPKQSVHSVDEQRLRQAQHIKKNPAVHRFADTTASTSLHHVPVTVHTNPAQLNPIKSVEKPQQAATEDLWQRAVDRATSHEQPKQKRQSKRAMILSRRKTSISALVVAIIMLGGFVGYTQLPNIRLHMASTQAGFAANLPGYKPAGFSLSHLDATAGQVAFQFHSNSDSRSYAITEKSSNWDSQTLRDTFVASFGHNYQTLQTAGHTLYVYGKNNATWVSAGVWYQIQTDGALGTHQLVQLASSL